MEKYDNKRFYEAQNRYNVAKDEQDRQIMFEEAYSACVSCIKKLSKKVGYKAYSLEDLESFALDATVNIFKRKCLADPNYKWDIQNLSNFVYLFCVGVFYSKKLIREQNNTSLEDYYKEQSYDPTDDYIDQLTEEGY